MSLNELVDMYNNQMNSNGSRSTFATDPSHHTPQSTFTTNTGFDTIADASNSFQNDNNFSFTDSASASLLYDADRSRFQLNDRVLAGEIVRPPPHNRPRIERIKHADTIVWSTSDADIHEYEHGEEYNKKYPDIKHQLNIITTQQAQLPPVNININPGEQIQRLMQQGKLKNFHGYINYPYNYVEPPWYFDQNDVHQGAVNRNPPPAYLTAQDIQLNRHEDYNNIQLPRGIPQNAISQDRYELIPLPKMVYENFVPLTAARRIVYRRQKADRCHAEPSFQQLNNSSIMASKLPEIDEMTFKI